MRKTALCILALILFYGAPELFNQEKKMPRKQEQLSLPMPVLRKDREAELNVTIEQRNTPVRFTSYYDGEDASQGTASGLKAKDFKVNEMGWFEYKGKVVLAAATVICLNAETGACAQYKTLPDNYKIHNLYDEITISVDEKQYDAIILDSCGACMRTNYKKDGSAEPYQRYDIYIAGSEYLFDEVGQVTETVYKLEGPTEE